MAIADRPRRSGRARARRLLRGDPAAYVAAIVLVGFLLAGLSAPLLGRWVTGFSPDELHGALALSPPGVRDVPRAHPAFDGDRTAFSRLDIDGDGFLTCQRVPAAGEGLPLLEAIARDWPVIHAEIVRSLEAIEARGLPLRDVLRQATGELVCPELDGPAAIWAGFHSQLFARYDGAPPGGSAAPAGPAAGAAARPDGVLTPGEYPRTDADLPDPGLAGRGLSGPTAFATLDRNGDGLLWPDELRRGTRHERFLPAGLLARFDADGDLRVSLEEFPGLPELAPFVLGTDAMGRDVLTRLLHGARVSLLVGVLATLLSFVIGVAYGAAAGYARPWLDELMMRLVDVLYGLPFPFLVILVLVVVGQSVVHLLVLLGLVQWMTMARIVRGQVRSLRHEPFVEAAEAYGARRRTIIWGHLARNAVGPVIAYAALMVAAVILEEAFLSFLGLGVPAGVPSWGSAIAEGSRHIEDYPWLIAAPATALGVTLYAFHFLGERLRRALGPRRGGRIRQ